MQDADLEAIVFHYKMMDSKGNLIESSEDKPVSVVLGENQVFEPIEKVISKMGSGADAKVFIESKSAYGDYDMDLVVQVPESKFISKPDYGKVYKVKLSNGVIRNMRVVDTKNGICILDGNHPLAGLDLLFHIEVLRRRRATLSEARLINTKLNNK